MAKRNSPTIRWTSRIYAGEHERFAGGAFDGQVGKVLPLRVGDLSLGLARVVRAEVDPSGTYVTLEYEPERDGDMTRGQIIEAMHGPPTDIAEGASERWTPDQRSPAVERFYADAWTDDWADLCDALGIDISTAEYNSRDLRKRVHAWAGDDPGRWASVYAAMGQP